MLVLFADSLVFQMLRLLIRAQVIILVMELVRFGWIRSTVEVTSPRYHLVLVIGGDITTAVTVKMLEYAVKAVEVVISCENWCL